MFRHVLVRLNKYRQSVLKLRALFQVAREITEARGLHGDGVELVEETRAGIHPPHWETYGV